MATKRKTAKKQTYTVRIEWPVTYYCDTTVEASSPEEAARIAMEDPDYDNQRSYDESGASTVEGVCEGDDYRYEDRIEVGGADEPDDGACFAAAGTKTTTEEACPTELAGVIAQIEEMLAGISSPNRAGWECMLDGLRDVKRRYWEST